MRKSPQQLPTSVPCTTFPSRRVLLSLRWRFPNLLRQSSLQELLAAPSAGPRRQYHNFLMAFAPAPLSTSPAVGPHSKVISAVACLHTQGRGADMSTEHEPGCDYSVLSQMPYCFDTGLALFSKRTPRPFPPPFLSPPSGSFSDALSTHHQSRDRRAAYIDGHLIQGHSNGDDAVFTSRYFIGANDGVGAWSARPRGHAGLWARLILHFWASAIYEDAVHQGDAYIPEPVAYLERAFQQTLEATSAPNDWQGTTTAAGAQLHYRRTTGPACASSTSTMKDHDCKETFEPLIYATNLGDSQIMVVRPSTRELVFKSDEQWHWFDCPRQLGTNSPDSPAANAVVTMVPIREGDVVLAMSDGVIDNLWTHEIVEKVSDSITRWRAGTTTVAGVDADGYRIVREEDANGMAFVAGQVMEAAKTIALDPFAESPFMERAIEEGLASEGGKLDDISVVAAMCRRNEPRLLAAVNDE